MDISAAQSELRRSYVHGGPGTLVSGFVWLAAAFTTSSAGISRGFAVLFLGGMLIFPAALLIVRIVFRREPPAKGNPGGLTVIETIFPMLGGFLAAWLMLPHRPEFVFPLAALAVGAHYFGFRTAYGDKAYWILAATLCIVGLASIFAKKPAGLAVPYVVGVVEIGFGIWFTWAAASRLDGRDGVDAMRRQIR